MTQVMCRFPAQLSFVGTCTDASCYFLHFLYNLQLADEMRGKIETFRAFEAIILGKFGGNRHFCYEKLRFSEKIAIFFEK